MYAFAMWLILGFGSLGLLIGSLTGLTANPIVATLLPLLFALMGGSIVLFLEKMDELKRSLAGAMLLAFSLCCIGGMFGGIWLSEHHSFSPGRTTAGGCPPLPESERTQPKLERPKADSPNTIDAPAVQNKYLRSAWTTQADAIDTQYRNSVISASQAYEELHALMQSKETASAFQK